MELILIGEHDVLAFLSNELTQSPEDFLADLEQQLEDGDITEEEAVQLVKDFTRRPQ